MSIRAFSQQDYNRVIGALDSVFAVFQETTLTDAEAAAAMKSFVESHYLKVWRPIDTGSKP